MAELLKGDTQGLKKSSWHLALVVLSGYLVSYVGFASTSMALLQVDD